jgi:hypothetical protein
MPLQLVPSPKPVGEELAPSSYASMPAKLKRVVISSEARNPLFLSNRNAVDYNEPHGGSAGIVEGFGGLGGLAGEAVGVLADAGLPDLAALPTVKYLRIFSRRFGPMPRIARKSSTLLNGPYDLRICKIFSAVTGPIPGTSCSSSELAVLILIGAGGGFFLACKHPTYTQSSASKRNIREASRNIIELIATQRRYTRYVYYSIAIPARQAILDSSPWTPEEMQ